MTKLVIVALLGIILTGCTTTKLVPQVLFPTPPELLMRPALELNTIKPVQTRVETPK